MKLQPTPGNLEIHVDLQNFKSIEKPERTHVWSNLKRYTNSSSIKR